MIIYMAISSWVLLSSFAKPQSLLKSKITSRIVIFLFVALLISLVPFRNWYDGDMKNYMDSFQSMRSLSLAQTLNHSTWEPLFVIMQWVMSRFTDNSNVYLMLSVALYVLILLTAIRNLFTGWQRMFVLFSYLNFVFFYAYIFNGMRQGFSMMFILLAMSYWLSDKPKPRNTYIYGVAAGLCHYSSLPFVVVMLLIRKFNIRLKFLLLFWAIGAMMFLTGLNSMLLNIGFISRNKFVSGYSGDALLNLYSAYGGGINQTKFLLFSGFFLFGSLILYKYIDMDEQKKEVYNKLIKCYIVFNTYFCFFGFVAFSDRIASYSWFLIPILTWYPILHNKKHSSILMLSATTATLIVGIITALDYYM